MTAGNSGGSIGRVRILELDPDLGNHLSARGFGEAVDVCVAPLLLLRRGPLWPSPLQPEGGSDSIGFLLVEGLLMEQLMIGGRQTTELLFPGDILRPWMSGDDFGELIVDRRWSVVEAGALALLDRSFVEAASRWPELMGAVAERAARRSKSLALRLAINQIPQVAARVHLTLWHLADRVGVVDREGVLVPVRLSRRALGELVSAQRPSVSRALKDLKAAGLVDTEDDGFRLRGPPAALTGRTTSPAPVAL